MRHLFLILVALVLFSLPVCAQVDPMKRNQLQIGYDQFLEGKGPQALYLYYYLNVPALVRSNVTLRLAVAPAYLDSEVGFRGLISPTTDFGIGIAGGAFSDNYYDVSQGYYNREQSFDGNGGGVSLGIYQRLNPGQLIPVHLVVRGGARYTTYSDTSHTADDFELPGDRVNLFTRVGMRIAGKEPYLYPDLGLEFSVWFERQWRLPSDSYGFNDELQVNAAENLFWAYAGINYAWTNIGHRISFAVTVGGSDNADHFSAWRLGGVLPLVAEFPLIIPGYYYQELSATRYLHLYGGYGIPLDSKDRWSLRLEGAGAMVEYLPGFEQPGKWNTGVGCGLIYTSPNKVLKVAVRYGYGFSAIRDGEKGASSVGILFQYDFQASKQKRSKAN